MKKATIYIPNMQSTHCQERVNNAISEIEGVQLQNLDAGILTASFTSDKTKDEAIDAIEKAGYTVSTKEESIS